MIVTTDELANLLNITPRRIQELEKDSIIDKIERNKWDATECIEKYINYKIDSATENFGLTEARAKKEKADADLKELVLKEKKGQVISLTKLEKELSDIAITLSNKLYSLPHKIKTSISLSEEIENELNRHIEEILYDLKNTKTYKEYKI
ncbi:hypothetical protein [Campylobacter sputorum]|uniref:hypothetical protein n=1 Tax=Campylobacter sputorum TaxID=206 RepID=UPI00053BF4D3|nr:hypothetical protein [Campylobacter sputorum]